MTTVMTLSPGQITLQDLTEIYWRDKLVRLNPTTRDRIDAAAVCIRDAAEGTETIYGVNTGFGKLANTRIALKDTIRLQRNLILSHSCGVGPPLPERIVRLVMALKLLSLGRGASGVRWEIISQIQAMLAKGVIPIMPAQGSVGASGDLAPLAHLTAAMIGEGEAVYKGRRMPGRNALAEAELRTSGLDPDRIVRCEALRYRHLSGRPSRNRVDRVTLSESAVSPVRLLLLGDYAESTTRELFSLVAEMADRYEKRGGSLETVLRRHAGARRSVPSPLGLLCRDGSGDLVEIATEVDIAVAGNRTSAAVDLHVLGVPVVVALDSGDLNCSPLRGVEGVRFAADSRDLLDAVLEVRERSRTGWEKDTPPILDLDPDLSGWSALFSTGNQ